MAKILDIGALVDVARSSGVPGADAHAQAIEASASALAAAVAAQLGIVTTGALLDDDGLMATFYAASLGQECPKGIHDGDEDGEWAERPAFARPALFPSA